MRTSPAAPRRWGHRSPRLPAPGRRTVLVSALAGALLLRSPVVAAGSFEPGTEPDPPTGALPVVTTDPVDSADEIRWEFAPLSVSGSLSLDGRWQRLDDTVRSRQGLLIGDIEFATYVWQPWFVQMRFGLGLVAARENLQEPDQPSRSTFQPATTGRFQLSVFPMSRFPFELRAEVGDSRVRGDAIGIDYRTRRLTVSQSYSPPDGETQYNLLIDHGSRTTLDGVRDVVTSLNGTATRQWDSHQLNLSAQHVASRFSETDAETRNSAVSLQHTYSRSGSLQTDSLASWNRSAFSSGAAGGSFDATTEIRQLSTFASWRPREGEPFHDEDAPLQVTSSARVVQVLQSGDGQRLDQQGVSLALGVAKDLNADWRISGSTSGSVLQVRRQARSHVINGTLGVAYAPASLTLGEWRYSPTLGASVGVGTSSREPDRQTLASQAGHAVSRSYPLGDTDSMSLSFSQSIGATRDSRQNAWTRQLVHASSVSWQGVGGESSQSYASMSVSDSRLTGDVGHSSFQLLNIQVSRRTQLSRDASWSGNLTLQGSRNRDRPGALVPADLGGGVDADASQNFYSGSLTYEHQRVFGVPRLRFTAVLSLNSQQLESRALGDIDAPRELVSKSIEGRFDYAIGRLHTLMSTRWIETDKRRIASVFVRLQRQF